jgi:hypothetical protein
MRNAWIRFGCFLTGYNYSILRNCSEVAKKTVKRYTAAMIIVCLLWSLIGYTFANRYLNAGVQGSIGAAVLFCIVIIQIERQIIMQTHKNTALQWFRGGIAVMMALIGSLIIDLVIFKDDIELQKEQFINNKVESIYPARAEIRQKQIDQLKKQLLSKDSQRTALNKDIADHPMISIAATQQTMVPKTNTSVGPDGLPVTQTLYVRKELRSTSQAPNPNIALLAPLDSQISSIQRLVLAQDDSLSNLRTSIERSLREKTGFLDELNIMFSLISSSPPALVVYVVWFLMLLGLECFILMSKRHETATDYDAMITHQMNVHVKKISILTEKGTAATLKPSVS